MGISTSAKPIAIGLLACYLLLCISLYAQPEIKVGVLLPLEAKTSSDLFNKVTQINDSQLNNTYQLNEQVSISLSFLSGLMQSSLGTDSIIPVEMKVFDTGLGDSLLPAILEKSKDALTDCQFIIGPVSSYGARLTAAFCKANRIVNIQPFSPSRTIATDNPFLIKLNPGIDVIVDNTIESILDSFRQAQVIVYAPAKGVEAGAAIRLDSLIRFSTLAQKAGITSRLCLVGGEKKSNIIDILGSAKNPVVVSTSLNLAWVQGILKPLAGKSVPLYGMPNWLQSEIIRLDYLNECSARIPDFFALDSSNSTIYDFSAQFLVENGLPPDRSAWLGRDVGDFCYSLLDSTGNIRLEENTRFSGLAHTFEISTRKESGKMLFWENSYCPIFRITDYQMKRVH